MSGCDNQKYHCIVQRQNTFVSLPYQQNWWEHGVDETARSDRVGQHVGQRKNGLFGQPHWSRQQGGVPTFWRMAQRLSHPDVKLADYRNVNVVGTCTLLIPVLVIPFTEEESPNGSRISTLAPWSSSKTWTPSWLYIIRAALWWPPRALKTCTERSPAFNPWWFASVTSRRKWKSSSWGRWTQIIEHLLIPATAVQLNEVVAMCPSSRQDV